MGRRKKRKSRRPPRRPPEPDEIFGLFYQRKGPLLYGCINFVKHSPNSTTLSTAYKTSSPFIVSETRGAQEVVLGSVVSLIHEVRRLSSETTTLLRRQYSDLRHLQPTTIEKGSRVERLAVLPDQLSEADARAYAEFKERLVGTLVLLSTQARNLFDIFPHLIEDRRISLVDYDRKPCGEVALRNLLTAFIHNRYLFLDGEYVSDLFPGDPEKSPINQTFMGYKFNWVEYVQEVERAALEIKFKHLTGRLRGWLGRLTLESRYDEIILLGAC